MKELPILFNPEMVQAIVAGRKTMTRRANGLQTITLNEAHYWKDSYCRKIIKQDGNTYAVFARKGKLGDTCFKFPYGQIGDMLWVRETWQPRGFVSEDDTEFLIHFPADGGTLSGYFSADDIETKYLNMIDLELDKKGLCIEEDGSWPGGECPLKNRPGIHLWKEFARIWLQITDIRMERLFAISEADAVAEGVESWQSVNIAGNEYRNYLKKGDEGKKWGYSELCARNSFIDLWEAINGHESVNSNPWVWVIEFKVLSTTGRPDTADQEAAAV